DMRPSSVRENGNPIGSTSTTACGPTAHLLTVAAGSPIQSDPLAVSYIGQRQSSVGSALAMAKVIPPWAGTVCERVGNTFEIMAVLYPACQSCKPARKSEPPPPTMMPSKGMVRARYDGLICAMVCLPHKDLIPQR